MLSENGTKLGIFSSLTDLARSQGLIINQSLQSAFFLWGDSPLGRLGVPWGFPWGSPGGSPWGVHPGGPPGEAPEGSGLILE